MLEIVRITDWNDPRIDEFGELQNRAYFDPDMLIPMWVIKQTMQNPSPHRNDVLLVAIEDGKVLGGTVFHYLPPAHAGFSSILAVDPEARGKGVAKALHLARWETLTEIAKAPPRAVFIDVVAPERLSEEEWAKEKEYGFDPRQRRKVFAGMGFKQLDIEYHQPVGGPDGGPVTNMDLLIYAPNLHEVFPLEWVLDTMHAYWVPWLGSERAHQATDELKMRAKSDPVGLLPPDHACHAEVFNDEVV